MVDSYNVGVGRQQRPNDDNVTVVEFTMASFIIHSNLIGRPLQRWTNQPINWNLEMNRLELNVFDSPSLNGAFRFETVDSFINIVLLQLISFSRHWFSEMKSRGASFWNEAGDQTKSISVNSKLKWEFFVVIISRCLEKWPTFGFLFFLFKYLVDLQRFPTLRIFKDPSESSALKFNGQWRRCQFV